MYVNICWVCTSSDAFRGLGIHIDSLFTGRRTHSIYVNLNIYKISYLYIYIYVLIYACLFIYIYIYISTHANFLTIPAGYGFVRGLTKVYKVPSLNESGLVKRNPVG